MALRVTACLLACLGVRSGWATVLTVTSTADSGLGSLRWAIVIANADVFVEKVTFAPALAGQAIKPLKALPKLTQSGTEIDGDLNDDGLPDITLDGISQPSGSGLWVAAGFCIIRGLAIVRMPSRGLLFTGASDGEVRSCHLGVDAAGMTALPNAGSDLLLSQSHRNLIGGGLAQSRNIIGAVGAPGHTGVEVWQSVANSIYQNYIGVRADGLSSFGGGRIGMALRGTAGATQTRVTKITKTLFGGLETGIAMEQADDNGVFGSYFGLGQDGTTPLSISLAGIAIGAGCASNSIGDGTLDGRNFFAGSSTAVGVKVDGPDTTANQVLGNYFGFTATGTAQRRLNIGVAIGPAAGAQTIRGTRTARNAFGPNGGAANEGVVLSGGTGTVITVNDFGVPQGGRSIATLGTGIAVHGVSPQITYNTIAQANRGIAVDASLANPAVYNNTFRTCTRAVQLTRGARCSLGNLSDASTRNDGGNDFALSNTWHVYNSTSNNIPAEGNVFGTTSKAEINAKIWDGSDARGLGLVDFIPLKGNVIPTAVTARVLGLTAAAAVPTATGVEVLFTLSAPAQVTVEVLNMAGRPVALVAHDLPADTGLQRIAWNGQSLAGTAAPAGRYLARITARDGTGAQATALAPFNLGH